MEYCEGGTLYQLLRDKGSGLPEEQFIDYLRQIAEGVKVTHFCLVFTGEVKYRNTIYLIYYPRFFWGSGFEVAEGWLLLDIGWFVLLLHNSLLFIYDVGVRSGMASIYIHVYTLKYVFRDSFKYDICFSYEE